MLCRAVSWKPHLSRTCRHLQQFMQMQVNLGESKLMYWRLRALSKPSLRHGDCMIRYVCRGGTGHGSAWRHSQIEVQVSYEEPVSVASQARRPARRAHTV